MMKVMKVMKMMECKVLLRIQLCLRFTVFVITPRIEMMLLEPWERLKCHHLLNENLD